jgi:fucose 4-O-acetylase-like acetyltransferase
MTGARRDTALDGLRGFLIFLVVLGHAVSGSDRIAPQNAWYGDLRTMIYAFHMPVFMFLSGHVAALVRSRTAATPLPRYLLERMDRLLVPFAAIGVAILLAKAAAHLVAPVPNYAGGPLTDGLWALFVDTGRSPARSIWFVFSLFCLLTVQTVLNRLHPRGEAIAFALATAAFVAFAATETRVPRMFYFDKTMAVAPYFFLGALAGPALSAVARGRTAWGLGLGAAAVVLLAIAPPTSWVAGVAICLVVVAALYAAADAFDRQPFLSLGENSMAIYLFNTMAIGAATVAVKLFQPWVLEDRVAFVAFVVLVTAVGIVGPILARRLVFARLPAVARYVR